jgi:hypothetical protein
MIVVVAAAMKARNPSRNIAQASSGAAIHIAANTTTIIVQVTAIHIGPGPRGRGGDPYPGTGG